MINNSYYSLSSLKLELYHDDVILSKATGYIVKYNKIYYLVTNYHVLSGRDFYSNEPLDKQCSIPNKIGIRYHLKEKPGHYKIYFQNLIDTEYLSGKKSNFDVGLLKLELENVNDVAIYDINIRDHRKLDAKLYPGSSLLIVGFPFGFSSWSNFPIWKHGILSSEIEFPYQGYNAFLIDAATRGGMSGSPVFAYFHGGSYSLKDGNRVITSKNYYKFLGTYSSRLIIPTKERASYNKNEIEQIESIGSDIGIVRKENCIDYLLEIIKQ